MTELAENLMKLIGDTWQRPKPIQFFAKSGNSDHVQFFWWVLAAVAEK